MQCPLYAKECTQNEWPQPVHELQSIWRSNPKVMRRLILLVVPVLSLTLSLPAQNKRLWVLRAPGEPVEYGSANFAEKQTVKIPKEDAASRQDFSIDHVGEVLFVMRAALPLLEGDLSAEPK